MIEFSLNKKDCNNFNFRVLKKNYLEKSLNFKDFSRIRVFEETTFIKLQNIAWTDAFFVKNKSRNSFNGV